MSWTEPKVVDDRQQGKTSPFIRMVASSHGAAQNSLGAYCDSPLVIHRGTFDAFIDRDVVSAISGNE